MNRPSLGAWNDPGKIIIVIKGPLQSVVRWAGGVGIGVELLGRWGLGRGGGIGVVRVCSVHGVFRG